MKPDMNRFHLQVEYQFVNYLDVAIRVVRGLFPRLLSNYAVMPVIPVQDVLELPWKLPQHLQEPLT